MPKSTYTNEPCNVTKKSDKSLQWVKEKIKVYTDKADGRYIYCSVS